MAMIGMNMAGEIFFYIFCPRLPRECCLILM
jgi:hypothetical protein